MERSAGPWLLPVIAAITVASLATNVYLVTRLAQRPWSPRRMSTPTCAWCAKNLKNIQTLAAERQAQYRFIVFSLNAVGSYLTTHPLGFEVLQQPAVDLLRSYAVGSTPQTIVVSSTGRVVKNWMGAYAGASAADVEAFFNVKLPGLIEVAAPGDTSGRGPGAVSVGDGRR